MGRKDATEKVPARRFRVTSASAAIVDRSASSTLPTLVPRERQLLGPADGTNTGQVLRSSGYHTLDRPTGVHLGAMRINTPSGTLVTSTTLGTRARARQYHSTRRFALMDKLGAPSQAGGVSGELGAHTCIRVFMTPLHGPYAHHRTHNLSRLARFTADTLAWEGVRVDADNTNVTRGTENEKRKEKHLAQVLKSNPSHTSLAPSYGGEARLARHKRE
ncbi:hypothetical protein C8J57DRAFT_1608912 [Mycena rebaudengoi]|nr:hypothetical protein C8J57DRAFT_1608912 [Mycena rebaudengoi]